MFAYPPRMLMLRIIVQQFDKKIQVITTNFTGNTTYNIIKLKEFIFT